MKKLLLLTLLIGFFPYWCIIMDVRHVYMQRANEDMDSAIACQVRQINYLLTNQQVMVKFEEQHHDNFKILADINYDKAENILYWIPKFTRP